MIMLAVGYLLRPVTPDGCLSFASEWWRKIDTRVFSLDVIECAGNRNLAFPSFWYGCLYSASMINLPELCNSGSEWDRSSAAMSNCIELGQSLSRGLVQNFNQVYCRGEGAECDAFTYGYWPISIERTVVNELHKHFNLPPGMLILSQSKDSFEWYSNYENGYWLWKDITSYWGKKAVEKLP